MYIDMLPMDSYVWMCVCVCVRMYRGVLIIICNAFRTHGRIELIKRDNQKKRIAWAIGQSVCMCMRERERKRDKEREYRRDGQWMLEGVRRNEIRLISAHIKARDICLKSNIDHSEYINIYKWNK